MPRGQERAYSTFPEFLVCTVSWDFRKRQVAFNISAVVRTNWTVESELWCASPTGAAFGVRPCVESGPQVATNDVPAVGECDCHRRHNSGPPKLLQTVELQSDPQQNRSLPHPLPCPCQDQGRLNDSALYDVLMNMSSAEERRGHWLEDRTSASPVIVLMSLSALRAIYILYASATSPPTMSREETERLPSRTR